jgi:transcriptional regulator with XRE-family HTH domain
VPSNFVALGEILLAPGHNPQSMDRIAKNIKLAREYKNLTQEHMAEAIGVSQATYCRIETGKTDIRVSVLRTIARAFKVPFSRLVSDDVVDLIRALQEQNKPQEA